MTIVATLYNGRTIFQATTTIVVPSLDAWITFTFPELDRVELMLFGQVLSTSPKTDVGSFSLKEISGNIVGVSLCDIGGGTTIYAEAFAIVI